MLIHLSVLINTACKVRKHIIFTEACNCSKEKMLVKNIQTDSWLEITLCLWLYILISSADRKNKLTAPRKTTMQIYVTNHHYLKMKCKCYGWVGKRQGTECILQHRQRFQFSIHPVLITWISASIILSPHKATDWFQLSLFRLLSMWNEYKYLASFTVQNRAGNSNISCKDKYLFACLQKQLISV